MTVKATGRSRSFVHHRPADGDRHPAGASFVVAGSLDWGSHWIWLGSRKSSTSASSKPRRRRLPPVRHIAIVNFGEDIRGVIVNPYQKPLSEFATINGIWLDQNGRIIASGSQTTDAVIRRGASVSFDLYGALQSTATEDAVRTAMVSVDPCGGDAAGTPGCPIAG